MSNKLSHLKNLFTAHGLRQKLSMTGAWLLLILVLGTAVAPCCRAEAFYGAPLVLNGKIILRYYAYSQTWADKHAEAILERLQKGLTAGYQPKELKVAGEGWNYTIYWRKMPICSVDRFQAACQKSYPKELALLWSGKLSKALQEGLLTLSTYSLVLPVNETKAIKILSGADPALKLNFNPAVVSAELDDSFSLINLKGLVPASTELWVQKGGFTAKLKIIVKDWAGEIPEDAYLMVTGNPITGDTLLQGALSVLESSCLIRPHANLTLNEPLDFPKAWSGGEISLKVPLNISGPNYLDRDKTINLNIRSTDLPLQDASVLMVSNRPEAFEAEGVLFEGETENQKPLRFMFAHKNNSKEKRMLWLNLHNPGDAPVVMLVLSALAGPDRSEIFVGHKANSRFLEVLGKQSGFLTTIPPGGNANLVEQWLTPQQLLSGILHLQILNGGKVQLSLRNANSPGEGTVHQLIDDDFDPFVVHPRGTFTEPYFNLEKTFSTHEQETAVEIGKAPYLLDIATGQPNLGNYGALYKVTFKLNNPESYPRNLGLFFMPAGGPAQASFLIKDQVTEIPTIPPYQQFLWRTLTLNAGENYNFNFWTMTEAGSAYPARIIVKTL